MKRFFRLLKYLLPYKWFVVQNVVYNILQAFFAIFSRPTLLSTQAAGIAAAAIAANPKVLLNFLRSITIQ